VPSVYDLKPRFQTLLRPLVQWLAARHVTANQVTIAAMLLSVAAGVAIVRQPANRWLLLLVPAVLLVRMALNAIDGMLAREHDMQSRLGAVLNELGDVISDAALYLPLALVPGFSPHLMVPVVVLAVMVEMTGVIASQIGASRRYDGPMGKSDRALVFGVVCLLLGSGVRPAAWLNVVLGVVVLLLVVTMVLRALRALRETRA
jgi:CDP-diacylglycerol--glycerol-3-phosphate 3-phosphatidyltransferase